MIKPFKKIAVIVLATLLALMSCQSQTRTEPPYNGHEPDSQSVETSYHYGNFNILSPITFKNLQLFPLTGNAELDEFTYLTLGVAMETDKVIVHETGSVNNLSITNKSDQFIYIQSGDIVKGGRQDRTIQYDVIIPPKAKKMQLSSFCVEQSRWSQRGNETANQFSTSKKMLSNRETKIAAKSKGDQSSVWSSVNKTQDKLNGTLKEEVDESLDVRANASESSLQLALENDELTKLVKEYKDHFDLKFPIDSVLGFAYAINGTFYGIEVYNNSYLFREMKRKLLEAVITEAISDKRKEEFTELSLDSLNSTLYSFDFVSKKFEINEACEWIESKDEKKKIHEYTLVDVEHGKKWLHRNIVNTFDLEEEQEYRKDDLVPSNQSLLRSIPIEE